MSVIIELLYESWIGPPKPELWPEYLQDTPVKGQGLYAFGQGLRLGFLLAAEAFFPETRA